MADNIQITAGTGTTVATEDVSGVQHQKVKIEFGADATATLVEDAAPLPTKSLSMPAAREDTDSIGAVPATGAVMLVTGAGATPTALTPKFASISTSASAELVSAVTSKKIRILALFIVATTAVTVQLKSNGAAGTSLTGAMPFGANGGISLAFNPAGWLETAAGVNLYLTLGSGVAVAGGLTYVEV